MLKLLRSKYALYLKAWNSTCALANGMLLRVLETDSEGKRHTWSWVTDIELTEETVEAVMRGGRCRWHIENQTFNTLKNQGYSM